MYYIIVNPIAGKGYALKQLGKIEKQLQNENIMYDVYKTTGKHDANNHLKMLIELDKLKFIRLLIVIGGDGTVHEVMNGLQGISIPVHYVKGGSGNDFYRGLQMMDDSSADYYVGTFLINESKNIFVNCIGFGFDAFVAHQANVSRWKQVFNTLRLGQFVYVIALIRSLFLYKPVTSTIQVDNEMYTYNKMLFAVVNNHPFIGGGMKINPMAKHERDQLSMIVANDIPKWKVLFLFMTVFFGIHTKFKGIEILNGQNIHIKMMEKSLYQTDGEVSETTEAIIYKTGESVIVQRDL